MASNAQRGAYFKGRTKKWLESIGYQVADLEKVYYIHTPKGRVPIKRDQFGSDLLAVSTLDVVFVQVKGGAAGSKKISAGRKAFAEFAFPPTTKQWVVAWKPRAREPLVVDCAAPEPIAEQAEESPIEPVDAPKKKSRSRSTKTGLF